MPQSPFRVITYNVLDGFAAFPERQARVAAWLTTQRPDVVAFQELNGYTEARLHEEGCRWGHEHGTLLKSDGYPTALTSRSPVADVERVVEGYHHGVLHASTAGIDFFVVHLSPHEFRVRAAEATRIANWAGRLVAEQREVIVLGDLNSLSPVDRPHYEAAGMMAFHRDRPDSQTDPNLNDGLPDFTVHQTLLDAGLVDVTARHTEVGPERTTCATPLIRRNESDAAWQRGLRRIDFILASPPMAERCTAAWIANGPEMDALSDHYPVVADFDW